MPGLPNGVRCMHYENGEHIPCPPMCPLQSWPTFMFRRKFWSRKWVLRKEFKWVTDGSRSGYTKP